jgi:hypothetical protein
MALDLDHAGMSETMRLVAGVGGAVGPSPGGELPDPPYLGDVVSDGTDNDVTDDADNDMVP